MKPNRFRQVLESHGVPIGHMIMEFGTRGMAKIPESADVDFVIIDMEHSGFGSERIGDLVAWFKATEIAPFVRVPQGLYHLIAPTMDAGALGVMVPDVKSVPEAQGVVAAVKYAPLGGRGVGLGIAHTDYLPVEPAAYFQASNENTSVICQIESPQGVANAANIAALPGVDVLWVGHSDLSQAMGIPGEFDHPSFQEALQKVVAAAAKHGKAAGVQPANLDQLEEWLSMGFNAVSWKLDIALYRSALQSELGSVRERILQQD